MGPVATPALAYDHVVSNGMFSAPPQLVGDAHLYGAATPHRPSGVHLPAALEVSVFDMGLMSIDQRSRDSGLFTGAGTAR
jgi:hypothetical protein